jgi:hypothetical protein
MQSTQTQNMYFTVLLYFLLHVSVIRIEYHQVEIYSYRRKSTTEEAPFHNQSAENTLDIILKGGIIKKTTKR